MSRNRYVKDYRLVETVSERGHISSSYEYIGDPYYFAGEPGHVKRDKKLAMALCPLLWALYLGAMLPQSFAMRTMFISLPFIFTALPLGILSDIVFSVCPAKEPLEHRHADKIENRLPPAALAAAFLPGAALIAELIRLLLGGAFRGGDLVFLICAALLTAGSAWLFSFRKKLAARKG